MSREGAGAREPKPPPAAGTPIWVWLVYALGILAAAIFVLSILFTLGALLLSDDEVGATYDVSTPAIVLWGVLVVAAAATWYVRRRRR